MNRSYTENDQFISNSGIYAQLYGEAEFDKKSIRSKLNVLLFKLYSLIEILVGATALRLYKVAGAALSLIGIIGIAGAIETGRLSIVAGLFLCALLLGVEYVCLRPAKKAESSVQ